MSGSGGMVLVLLGMCVSLMTILIYCYTGSSATATLGELADVAYHSKWYTYDLKQRKWLIIIIANCQKPLIFDGFKVTQLSLATFARVNYRKSQKKSIMYLMFCCFFPDFKYII